MVKVSKPASRRGWLLLAGVAVVAAGVLAAGAPSRTSLVFSHADHQARDERAVCIDCHDAKSIARAAPALKGERCLHCHDETLRYKPRVAPTLLAVRFPHASHAPTVACAQCHQPKAAPPRMPSSSTILAASKADVVNLPAEWSTTSESQGCFDCHKNTSKAPASVDCKSCHVVDARNQRPSTHSSQWMESHGPFGMLNGSPDHGQSCNLCHRDSSCRSCHQVRQPRDHNALWRMRTHGVAASWDRTRCQTCHQGGQCISCHATTEPLNHRGAWVSTHGLVAGSRLDGNCLTCHRPNFCIDCHAGRR